MSQVKQILRLHHQGKGIKTIAKALSVSKNTVKGYVRKADASSLPMETLLALEDPVLEGRLLPGNPAYKDERYERLKPHLADYCKELGKVGVTRFLLWEEYRTGNPYPYSYAQFCYHMLQHLRSGKPSMVLDHRKGGINHAISNLLTHDFNRVSPDYNSILERELRRVNFNNKFQEFFNGILPFTIVLSKKDPFLIKIELSI